VTPGAYENEDRTGTISGVATGPAEQRQAGRT
jgi:hypothetical protein